MKALRQFRSMLAPRNSRLLNRSDEEVVAAAANRSAEATIDRDTMVRDIGFAALDKTLGYIKTISIVIVVPIAIFGFFGLKDATQFFLIIQPKIDAAQRSINSQLSEMKTNEHLIGQLNQDLATERGTLVNTSTEMASARTKIEGLSQQITSLTTQAKAYEARSAETSLEEDFTSLIPGKQDIRLNGKSYTPPSGLTPDKPLVYLVASAGPVTDLSIDEVKDFSKQLIGLGYSFVHGSFALWRGQQGFGAGIIPFPSCTGVLYFDRSYLNAATQVAKLLATTFKVAAPVPLLVDPPNNRFFDPTAAQIILKVKIGIAASVNSPTLPICSNPSVKSLQ